MNCSFRLGPVKIGPMNELCGHDLAGLWVPIITPFTHEGDLDPPSLKRLAERLIADGAAGLVALGTTGEPATLTRSERRQVVEVCARVCSEGDRTLIVGAGTNSTRGTIDELGYLTKNTTVAAALIVTPYYTRPSEQAVVEHFGLVADASPIPLIVYNIPHRTGRGLGSSALIETSLHPNIIGLKQSVGTLDFDTLDALAQCDQRFGVLAGDDAFIAPTLLMGGTGAIAAAAHVCTPLFAEMIEVALAGDVGRARQLARLLLPVVHTGFSEPSPGVWKGALANRGEITSGVLRRPLTAASIHAIERLCDAIDAANRSR